MITEQDLAQAIAECQGERHPNANTCIKLAAFYTIRSHLFGKPVTDTPDAPVVSPQYSYDAGAPVEYDGDSEFAQAIQGKAPADVWPVIDELMDVLRHVNVRLYEAVMRRL